MERIRASSARQRRSGTRRPTAAPAPFCADGVAASAPGPSCSRPIRWIARGGSAADAAAQPRSARAGGTERSARLDRKHGRHIGGCPGGWSAFSRPAAGLLIIARFRGIGEGNSTDVGRATFRGGRGSGACMVAFLPVAHRRPLAGCAFTRPADLPALCRQLSARRRSLGRMATPAARRRQWSRGCTFSHSSCSERMTRSCGTRPPQFNSARMPLRPSCSLSSARRSATISGVPRMARPRRASS